MELYRNTSGNWNDRDIVLPGPLTLTVIETCRTTFVIE